MQLEETASEGKRKGELVCGKYSAIPRFLSGTHACVFERQRRDFYYSLTRRFAWKLSIFFSRGGKVKPEIVSPRSVFYGISGCRRNGFFDWRRFNFKKLKPPRGRAREVYRHSKVRLRVINAIKRGVQRANRVERARARAHESARSLITSFDEQSGNYTTT